MNRVSYCVLALCTVSACALTPEDQAPSAEDGTAKAEQPLDGGLIGVKALYTSLAGPTCSGVVEALGDAVDANATYTFTLYRDGAQIDQAQMKLKQCPNPPFCQQPYAAFHVDSAGEYQVKYKATTKWGLFFNLNYTGDSNIVDARANYYCPSLPRPPVPPFAWSSAGPIAGMHCANINESVDHHTWSDNFFCSANDYGLRFSSAGAIAGLNCVKVNEPGDPDTWDDNYLCSRTNLNFTWSFDGTIPGRQCVRWSEPADPHGWDDNYLCR